MKIKFAIGILISAVFIYFTFRDVNFQSIVSALVNANYLWVIPALILMFASHWLRAMRWSDMLAPVKRVPTHSSFSALMIGYAANNIFPMRMGEFFRAYAIARSEKISKSSAFATVVIERFILDLVPLLVLLGCAAVLTPALISNEIKMGGYAVVGIIVCAIVFIVFLLNKTDATIRFLEFALPARLFSIAQNVLPSFVEGCAVFKKSHHYIRITSTTAVIWILYIASVYYTLYIFDFQTKYDLGISGALLVLVFATFSIMIPSSPGYVGTYHLAVALSLQLLHVAEGEAKSFALISHMLNVVPISLLGLFYFWKQNMRFATVLADKQSAG